MSYFDKIDVDLRKLWSWADLRHEQGCDIAAEMHALADRISELYRRLADRVPPADLAAREPNDLGAILAARDEGPRRLWDSLDEPEYRRRVEGAWLARCAGCTLGAIVEGWPVERMRQAAEYQGADFPPTDYWPAADSPHAMRYLKDNKAAYTRANLRYVPVDDDLTYTLLGLLILEQYGPEFTTADVAATWLTHLPMAYTAEHVTLENLRAGVPWQRAGEKDNPYVEWIGADIRADPWGYAAPGQPARAAEMAWRDAALSHRHNGIYGAMYFAAAIAAAFATDEPMDACRVALSEIPARCRLHDDLVWALDRADGLGDYLQARRLVDDRFGGMSHVHTNNNACLTLFGLALGGRDVTKVIGNTVAMGMDNDCTAATAGSIVGAAVGADNVPARWCAPFAGKVRTYMNGHEWFTIPDIVDRFTAAARAVWNAS
jgi:ADP-ribosylglycohydrolase